VPAEFRQSGPQSYIEDASTWLDAARAFREDEFSSWNPPGSRLGVRDGGLRRDASFKNLLAAEYEIQLNKTSRNSSCCRTNINNTRSDVANLLRSCRDLQGDRERLRAAASDAEGLRVAGESRSWKTSRLPNFSCFHDRSATSRRVRRWKGTCAPRSTCYDEKAASTSGS